MRIRIEGTAHELEEKREELVKALMEGIEPLDAGLAEVLAKALPQKESPLKHRALRELHKLTTEAYEAHMQRMVADIGKVLDGGTVLKKADEEPEEPAGEPDDPDEDPETGEPIYDPQTGLTPSETEQDKEENPEDYEEEGDELEGSEMAKADCHVLELFPRAPYLFLDGEPWTPDMEKASPRGAAGPPKVIAIGPQGGKIIGYRYGKPIYLKEESRGAPKGAQVGLLFSTPEPKKKPKLQIVGQKDPALTEEQNKKQKSEALKSIAARMDEILDPKKAKKAFELPAGARIKDPWAPPESPGKWSHPDIGQGTGDPPWFKEGWTPDLFSYDHIVVNSSAGKDSQAMLSRIVELADKQGYPRDRIVVVHADLGRVEWDRTKELAKAQADHYGLRFEVVQRKKDDLLEQIEARYGDLMQKQADTEALRVAGVKTWKDLAELDVKKLAGIIGPGKGTSQWEPEDRAKKLLSGTGGVHQKHKKAKNQHERSIKEAEEGVQKATKTVASAKSEKAKANAKERQKKWASRLKELKSMGDPWDFPIDYGMPIAWPSMGSRYCTADHKRNEVDKFLTALADDIRSKDPSRKGDKAPRFLNTLGIRAQEGEGRNKMSAFQRDKATSNQVIDDWFPIHRWHEKRVWETIEKSGIPHHVAYDMGMRRLSCVFCVFASPEDLMIAATHNPKLFEKYLELEEKVGTSFKADHSLADIRDEIKKRIEAGYTLTETAEWVKKALGLDIDTEELAKAIQKENNDGTPTMVGAVLEAAYQRLEKLGETIIGVAIEWKGGGLCVHLETGMLSHHVEYVQYPEAYSASMIVAAYAQAKGLAFEEHNTIPPERQAIEEDMEKAGPYVGPRGGLWEDPEHTRAYRKVKPSVQALNTLAHKLGGKVKEHKTDPNKLVLKLPKKYVQKMMELKQQLKVPHEIMVGEKYVILPIDKKSTTKPKPKKKSPPAKVKPSVVHQPSGQIPPYAGIPWTEPKTIDEAEEWCASNGITASFPDLKTARAVTRAVSESHPYVVQHVQFIGTPEQQKAWAKTQPELVAAAKQAKHAMDITKQSPLGPGAAAVAHPLTKKPYTKSMVIVQPSYWNETKATELKGATGGFSVSESLGDIVRHEFGHVEAFTMRHIYPIEGDNRSMWQIWKDHVIPQLKSKQVSKDISQYGNTNPHEAWAELSVLRRRGHPMPDWAQKAIDEMRIDEAPWAGMMPNNPWGPQ